MNRPITVSVNPTYFCNFRCDFCYLTPEQLADRHKVDLDILDKRLDEISSYRKIDWIDLYGGEIGALKSSYIKDMIDVFKKYYDDKINIITNYSMLRDEFFRDDVYLSVSYDFEAREKHERVWDNLMYSRKPVALLILASPKVIEMDVDDMIQQINLCSSIESVEIKPYSSNQANQLNVGHDQFEEFVKKWITTDKCKKFDFINEGRILDSLNKRYNAFSNDHVYITPKGNFGVLEFDINDNEYFLELDNFYQYEKWAKNEPTTNVSDICRKCDYYGHCLTEHYRYVKDLEHSCNGYIGLLNWYNSNYVKRVENKTKDIS